MKTYSLIELNKISKDLKFNRDTLEKVLRLAELLKLFNKHIELKDKYVLKGGTAINLCLFDLPRLSVDIDLDFNMDCTKEELKEIRKLHNKIIRENVSINNYVVHAKSRFTYTLDSFLLQYTNAVGSNDYIKLELNYSNRVHILKPKIYKIRSKIIDETNVLAMDKIELYGSKIAALIGRTTARDIFDVSEMINYKIIKKEEFGMLRKIVIYYLLLSNEFEPLQELINKFKRNMEMIDFNHIKRNLIPMLKVGSVIDINNLNEIIVKFMDELFILTKNEQKYIDLYNEGKYNPSLLFAKDIASKLENHPIAIWKMKNFKTNIKKI